MVPSFFSTTVLLYVGVEIILTAALLQCELHILPCFMQPQLQPRPVHGLVHLKPLFSMTKQGNVGLRFGQPDMIHS